MISKEAKRKYDKEYREKNKEKRKEYDKENYQKNKEKIKARVEKYRQENLEDKERRRTRSKKYREKHPLKCRMVQWKGRGINITYDGYKEMLKKQKSKCAICGVEESELKYKLCLDHDHRNGEPRGLLCRKCNSVLGMIERESEKDFRDPIPILKNAIKYIGKK